MTTTESETKHGRDSSCTVGADVLLVAVKDIFRNAPGSAIRGVGRFKAGTPLYGHRACIYPRLWSVTDRNSSWPWCVGVPDAFVAEEKQNTRLDRPGGAKETP